MKRSPSSPFTIGAGLALAILAHGCGNDSGGSGSSKASGGSPQAGQISGGGGSIGSSGGSAGATVTSGGSTANGGASTVVSVGGNASGGSSKASGGSSASSVTSMTGGSTGAGGTGGTSASGGSSKTGGTAATGGATGGSTTAGGTSATGGTRTGGTAAGGTSAAGGTTAVGGTSAAGGSSKAGGTTASAGTTAVGGTSAAGGSSATGGTTKPAGNEFWIAPDGKDTATGSKDDPLFSLCDDSLKTGACYKLCPSSTCTSGTIWVKDGTYKYGTVTQKIGSTKLGTANGALNVFADAGAKPVFDFTGMAIASANRGIQLQGDYWHIKGITVTKAGDTGIFVMGNHNTIEQCVTHHNADAGLVIGVNSGRSDASGTYNLILNCDSYQNLDSATNGENADGFGMKENSGEGNVFRGCRAWDNADDGWDLYAWASPVTIENCWAINQGKTTGGSASDANGFKLGGDKVKAQHILKDLYATGNGTGSFGSSGCGFTNNSNPASLSCTGTCASWGNKASDTGVGGVGTTAPAGATAQKMIDASRDADGNLPAITSL